MPILTSYATRVSGRTRPELMKSRAAMARALADTHKLVGCDGALCFWDPMLLPSACTLGNELREVEDVIAAPGFQFLLETARALRQQLPPASQVFAAFAGPGYLASQVTNEGADEAYIEEVLVTAVRAGLEAGTQGVAFIEAGPATLPRTYRGLRKLVDFYEAKLMVFQLPGTAECPADADCVFRLPGSDAVEAVEGSVKAGTAPITSSCDIPPQTPIEHILALRQGAARLG